MTLLPGSNCIHSPFFDLCNEINVPLYPSMFLDVLKIANIKEPKVKGLRLLQLINTFKEFTPFPHSFSNYVHIHQNMFILYSKDWAIIIDRHFWFVLVKP